MSFQEIRSSSEIWRHWLMKLLEFWETLNLAGYKIGFLYILVTSWYYEVAGQGVAPHNSS